LDKSQRTIVISLLITLFSTAGLITLLSVPLGFFPPLGNFLFPGRGLWDTESEVPNKVTIHSDELTADVTVFRDQWGIPHIFGESEPDLLFALGYVQAQDRLFQMDLARRATEGKLAEILGSDLIEYDKFALNKLMAFWTEKTYQALIESSNPIDQEILTLIQAFSAGVNHYIETTPVLPLEFQFLNYRPSPWEPRDTLVFIKYMSEMLTWSYSDFTNTLIKNAIGSTGFQELFGYPLPYQVPIVPDYGSSFNKSSLSKQLNVSDYPRETYVALSKSVIKKIKQLSREQQFLNPVDILGSNNWVVSGNKTASGKPILCNDMHLGFDLPGIWYEAHLVNQLPGADFNVYGFFLAGVPFPIVGHNNHVAWGMTNTAYDVIDWYFYDLVNETHYQYRGHPTKFGEITYEINVRGQAPTTFTIKTTVHGPVFEDMVDSSYFPEYAGKVIACQWLGQRTTHEARTIYLFARAKNRLDFNQASQYFSTPAQNIVYADIYGNIGIRPTGQVPIRNDTGIPSWHSGNGTMLYNGSAGEGDWIGFIPFEKLPHSENPAQGYLCSANQVIAGPAFLKNYTLQNPTTISNGYRARRINTLLATNDEITIEDMKRFLLDVHSVKAGNATSYLIAALESLPTKTSLQTAALNALRGWDYQMITSSSAATIFNAWYERFRFRTFHDDVIEPGSPKYPSNAVLEWLVKNNASSKWFDNKTTPTIETRDDIILLALDDTLTALTAFFGTEDISQWRWGRLHQLRIEHLTRLDPLGFGPVEVNGTGETVSPFSGYRLWNGDNIQLDYSDHGSSERMIIDLGNLNNSLSIIPSGERGITNSKHYIDLLQMYLQGEYHLQYFGYTSTTTFAQLPIESIIYFKAGGK